MILTTNFSKLVMDGQTCSLLSLKNKQGTEFLADTKLPLFSFCILENGQRRHHSAADFPQVAVQNHTVTYTGFLGLTVHCAVAADTEGYSFTMQIENPSRVTVEWMNYPNLLCKDMLKEGFRALLPMFEGVEISDFRLRKMYFPYEELKYPSGGWDGEYPGSAATQCLAYYNGKEGLYFASHDSTHQLKQIDCEDREDGLHFINRLYGIGDAEHYDYGYDLRLQLYDGGFYEAAELYRSFALQHISLPKLKDNSNLPQWTKESPIVTIYAIRGERDTGHMDVQPCYYPYTNALPALENLKSELDSDLMVLLAHWEGTAPWAPPQVWPPYGDKENFRVFSEKLHEMNCRFGLYCSGLGFTTKSVIWPEYEKTADPDIMCVDTGENHAESKICRGAIRFGHDLCVSHPKTHEIVLHEIESMTKGCQVDYIQFFDQNVGGLPCLCYSENHNHPSVPGKWLVEETHGLIDGMYQNTNALLGCEGAASEAFMDKLHFNDGRNYMGFPIGQPRPLFDYVYHEYVSNFMGNQNTVSCYVFTDEAPEIIFYKTAYFFAQGNVLTVVLGKDGKLHWDWGTPWEAKPVDHEAYAAFVKELNGWRKKSLYNALQYGQMVKPLDVRCGEYAVPTYELYYPTFHQGKTYYGNNRYYPSIITNAYETEDGTTQVFVNFSYKTQRFSVELGETERTYTLYWDKDDTVGETVTAKDNLPLEIPPRSVLKMIY